MIGYLTDLTYSRRTPLAVLSIFLATIMQVCLIIMNPDSKLLFFIYIFFFGLLMVGAIAIISGISCADLVTYFYAYFRIIGKTKITKQQ